MEVAQALKITTDRSRLGMTFDKLDSMFVNSRKNKLHNMKTETNILYTSCQINKHFRRVLQRSNVISLCTFSSFQLNYNKRKVSKQRCFERANNWSLKV